MTAKRMTRYAVMVNNEMWPDSLSLTRDGAGSYVGDAKNAAVKGAKVRVVKVIIVELKPKRAIRNPLLESTYPGD